MRVLLLVFMLVALLAGCGGDAERIAELEAEVADLQQQLHDATSTTTTVAPQSESITGVLILSGDDYAPFGSAVGGRCWGRGGFDDITAGAGVIVRDSDGTILAASSLGAGVRSTDACEFVFTAEVPSGLPFYTIEVSHRGEVIYSLADLRDNLWQVALELK